MNHEAGFEKQREFARNYLESCPGFALDDINIFDSVFIETSTSPDIQKTGRIQIQLLAWHMVGYNPLDKPKRVVITDTNLPELKVGTQYMVDGATAGNYVEERGIIRRGCGIALTPIKFTNIHDTDIGRLSNDEITEYYKLGYIEKVPHIMHYVHPSLSFPSIVTPAVSEISKIDYESGGMATLPWYPPIMFDHDDL